MRGCFAWLLRLWRHDDTKRTRLVARVTTVDDAVSPTTCLPPTSTTC